MPCRCRRVSATGDRVFSLPSAGWSFVFDMETGLFRIDNEFEKEVRLVGHGNKYAMVRKALQRNGILASRRVESDFYIETGDMTTNGYIIHPVAGRTIKVDTIEELLEQVTAILASV